ncbi:hypothetical protein SEA_TELAVIV_88 [Mycobacterium phage TelAviv]|nr:hypothetical protein SEA_TELAVIV_88 [Mycobacterium phage TelAviv]
MGLTLQRRDRPDEAPTAVLRVRNPNDRRDLSKLLPWMTPQFVFLAAKHDWVRWACPEEVAKRFGLDATCPCCGEGFESSEDGQLVIDTLLEETGWWLTENDYTIPTKEGEHS